MKSIFKLFVLTLAFFICGQAFAQTQPISGKIVDTMGEPLIGVSVKVKGNESTGTVTDIDGQFSLNVSGDATLIISYVGYITSEIKVGGQTHFNITLNENDQELEEIVVVGYGTQKKSSLTGAISNIKSDELTSTTTTTTSGALVGKVAGISARQADGRPGASAKIQIRNMGTPLYVIDGIPSEEGQFNNIDVNDIDNISVLKDASAAIYGLRAANGVVLVTTKGGKRGSRNSINASGYYGIQNFMRYPDPANAYEYVRGLMDSDLNKYGSTSRTMDELEKWSDGTYKSMNWKDFIVNKNAPMLYGNINASGGSDKVSYYFSLAHTKQDAMIKGFDFERTNLQANIDANITNDLKVGTKLSGRSEKRTSVGVPGLDDYWQPYWAIFQNLPTERAYANENPNYPNKTHNDATGAAIFDKNTTGTNRDIWRVMSANLFAEYKAPFLQGLSARVAYNYWIAKRNNEEFEYTYNTYTYNESTDEYDVTGGNSNPWRRKETEHRIERTYQAQINYANIFDKVHNVSAMIGAEAFERKDEHFRINTLPPNNYIGTINNVDEITDVYNTVGTRARAGFIFRTTYDYASKYFLEASGRYDGSFLFRSGDRWGFFPSVSAGWRISEEEFLKPYTENWLYNLKLRASWGQMGDDQYNEADIVDPFSYLDGYDYGDGKAVLNGSTVNGIKPRGLPITTLSWIKSTVFNIGIDFGVLDNRLSGTVEYFRRKRTGLPASRYDVSIPAEVGFELPMENLNSDAHLGVEASLMWNDKIDKVNYYVGANVTLARKKDLYVYKERFGSSWHRYRDGKSDRWSNINWGFECIGQFQSMDEIKNYPVDIDGLGNTTMLPGDLIIKDVNGDGVINDLDQRPVGYAAGELPYLNFAFNLGAEWNGIDLKAEFAGASMQTYQRDWELKIPYQAGGSAPNYLLNDAWHHADPTNAYSEWIKGKYPSVREGGSHVNWTRNSTFWQTNITYLKLRTLEIGYTIPKSITSRANIQKLRLYVNGYNLVSFDNMKEYDIDPEITSTSGLVTPNLRTISFGFNLNF